MKCIVVDDEPMAIEVIAAYCHKTPFLELVETFDDAVMALTWLQHNKVQLIFLDINMPDLSGIQFVKALNDPPLIIFTTAYSQHAVTGFELNAIDYLLKPVGFARFLKAADKARQREEAALEKPVSHEAPTPEPPTSDPPNKFIFVKSGHKHIRLEVDRIRYIVSEKNYVSLITDQQRVMALLSMDKVLELLPSGFVRVHKSYIVAMKHVDVVEKTQLNIGETEIPIGDAYRKAFFEHIDG